MNIYSILRFKSASVLTLVLVLLFLFSTFPEVTAAQLSDSSEASTSSPGVGDNTFVASTTITFVSDMCANLDGDQVVVPSGYELTGGDQCVVRAAESAPSLATTTASTSDVMEPSTATATTTTSTSTSTSTATTTPPAPDSEPKQPPPSVINTCLIPDSLGDTGSLILGTSSEKTLAQMLAEHGYSAIHTLSDQVSFQVWNLTDVTAASVTFQMRVLGKEAGNSQIVGYYRAGDTLTFTPVLSQSLNTNGETAISVTIPAAFASSFGFALQSADKTWFSERSLNSDGLDHVVVYNPSSNTYLLAFEDFNNLGDADYNDILIEIKGVTCNKNNGGGDNGDNGDDGNGVGGGGSDNSNTGGGGGGGGGGGATRITDRQPTPQVLGDSVVVPPGLVLGESTSTLPVGAPATGGGGTAPVAATVPTMSAVLSSRMRALVVVA